MNIKQIKEMWEMEKLQSTHEGKLILDEFFIKMVDEVIEEVERLSELISS